MDEARKIKHPGGGGVDVDGSSAGVTSYPALRAVSEDFAGRRGCHDKLRGRQQVSVYCDTMTQFKELKLKLF